MRIRSIKPEFWRSDDITALDISARLTFIGLWSYVDDNGVGADKVASIVADLFADDMARDPSDTLARVSMDLLTLSKGGQIVRYQDGKRALLFVTEWDKHQKIDKPSLGHQYPRPPAEMIIEARQLATVSRDPADTPSPGAGEQGSRGAGEQGSRGGSELALVEGSGETTAKAVARRRPRSYLPADFVPELSVIEAMMKELSCTKDSLAAQHRKFCDYWLAEGKMKTDWTATWRNWMRTAHQRGDLGRAPTAGPAPGDAKINEYLERGRALGGQ